MSNVVDLFPTSTDEEQPHIQGKARCLKCRHEWHCVAPAGTINFECPSCEGMAGQFVDAVVADELSYRCQCGCMTFGVSTGGAGVYCSLCGTTQVFE